MRSVTQADNEIISLTDIPRMKSFQYQVALRDRVCDNCRLTIYKGERCLRFTYGSSYYKVTANLCRTCMLNMINFPDEMPNG